MLKKRTGLGLAIALGGAVSLSAQSATTTAPQSPTASDANELNIVGCVSKSADGGFVLTNARVEPATPGTAGAAATTTSGGGTTTTGTSGSAATRPTEPAGSGTSGMTTWALKGGSDLEKHIGHKVQVTGRAEAHQSNAPASTSSSATSPSSATGRTGATGSASATDVSDEAHTRALDVQSIKMLATRCP
jgi:hypothetical protein